MFWIFVLCICCLLLGAVLGILAYAAIESAKYEEDYFKCNNCPNMNCRLREGDIRGE